MTSDFFSETRLTRREWNGVFSFKRETKEKPLKFCTLPTYPSKVKKK
jgi:hypothetical protein